MSNFLTIEAEELYEETSDQEAFCEMASGMNKQFMSLLHQHPAVALIDSWLNDDSGYDEAIWPELKESIEKDRLSTGRDFMSKRSMLDTGPLGRLCHPKPNREIAEWFKKTLGDRHELLIPEIADYELRREYILAGLNQSLHGLSSDIG